MKIPDGDGGHYAVGSVGRDAQGAVLIDLDSFPTEALAGFLADFRRDEGEDPELCAAVQEYVREREAADPLSERQLVTGAMAEVRATVLEHDTETGMVLVETERGERINLPGGLPVLLVDESVVSAA